MAHTGLQFSWSDSCRAALSCLPCLKSSDEPSDSEYDNQNANRHLNGALAHVIIPPPRARPDELEGLLADASDDAETLSLHSNIGDRSRRGRKSKQRRRRDGGPKHIRVFGFDLFGRPPAIQLPESDEEEAGEGRAARRRPRTISTDTLDSDAAPLDVSAIQELSAARHAEALAREDEERRAKEERRRRRREKRELKRAAMARALELHADANEDSSRSYSISYSNSAGQAAAPYNHQFLAQQQTMPRSPLSPLSPDTDSVPPSPGAGVPPIANGERKKKHRRKSARSKAHSVSVAGSASGSSNGRSQSATASQTASLVSPLQSDAPGPAPRVFSPAHAQDFEGFPGGFGEHAPGAEQEQELRAPVHGAFGEGEGEGEEDEERARKERARASAHLAVASFPSVGLRGVQRTKSDMGVFLARRGDE
ncbi:hypothetical protein FKP32DRAFT_1604773 [Trametes sanguinea]|nr:hypothetical protein FKP32DRAFT_1604773 [Trametes sanguinea]